MSECVCICDTYTQIHTYQCGFKCKRLLTGKKYVYVYIFSGNVKKRKKWNKTLFYLCFCFSPKYLENCVFVWKYVQYVSNGFVVVLFLVNDISLYFPNFVFGHKWFIQKKLNIILVKRENNFSINFKFVETVFKIVDLFIKFLTVNCNKISIVKFLQNY